MPRKATATASLYSVHPSIAYLRAIVDNLPEKTGKSLADWVKLIKNEAPKDPQKVRDWLKKEFKLGGTTSSMITDAALGKGDDTNPDAYLKAAPGYVEAMYVGKEALRPIHDALIKISRSLGPDIKICPCETIVPVYRNHVIAQIKPTTRTRIGFGFALNGCTRPLAKRLLDTGGLQKGDRITHRIPLTSVAAIDAEVKTWLKIAYNLDAKS